MSRVKKGYKQTKVGIIPEEWEVVRLDKIIRYKKGYAFKSSDYQTEGVPIIRVSDTGFNKINDSNLVCIDKEKAKIYDSYKLKTDDIIITTVGSKPPLYDSMVGKIILVPKKNENHLLNQNAVKIFSKIANNRYIFYQFLSKRYIYHIKTIYRGNANQASITLNDLFAFSLPLPPLKEQQKIAQILTTWDRAISNVELLILNYELRKKGLMQKLLSGEVRFEGFDGEWEEVRLGDVAEIIMGQSPSSKSYNENKEGVPLIQGNADCKNRKTAPRIYTTEKTKVCNIGDIIMTVRAPVGVISKAYHNACIGRGVCAIRTKDDNGFLYYYLLKYEEKWEKYSQGSTFTAVNSNDIKSLKIKFPPLEEQQKIAQLLTTADREIELLKEELEALKEQKRGLMQKLLTGEVRVKINGGERL